jgi:hypothetical protein
MLFSKKDRMKPRPKLTALLISTTLLASFATYEAVAQQAQARRRAGNQQNAAAAGAGARRRQAGPAKATTAPAGIVYGAKLSGAEGYHAQVAACETPDGNLHTAWVTYQENVGDYVFVRSTQKGAKAGLTAITGLTPTPGQYIRPVIAAAGNDLMCLWTTTNETNLSTIWYSHTSGGSWTPAARLLPDDKAPHQNPEIAASHDGKRFAVIYQHHNGRTYDLHVQTFENGKWSDPTPANTDKSDCWDPVVTFDAKDQLHAAWSAYVDGDYDVYWSRPLTKGVEPRRVSARGEYDMHPWLAASPEGPVWINWDVVRLKNHGYSGGTTITGANHNRGAADTNEGQAAHWSGIEVRVLDGDSVRIPGNPREEIVAPQGYAIAHRGLGKIVVGPNGDPWIVYRALMKPIAFWSPNVRDGYLWELMARPFKDGAWQSPITFAESDGYLEEPAVVPANGGVRVAYTTEHRHSSVSDVSFHVQKKGADAPAATPTTQPVDAIYDHHHDFAGYAGWHGDVYAATLPLWLDTPIDLASLPVEEKPTDRPVDKRLTRDVGAHEVKTAQGQTYKLLWGDLHRHSNISRCSVGNEPNPEDLYRYGLDVNRYDFLGLSDHAEHTTDYYWWRQQKFADLYHIPDVFSVLYNYEWSMGFPQGHTNTIFPSRHNVKMNPKGAAATGTLMGGWELLERCGYQAITIPHTPADPNMGTTWPAYNPKYERLCEIFQACRGSYEYEGCPRQHGQATNKQGFYWKALEKNYHLGIICSSDHGYGCAYACVYAPENTRDSVWNALYDRRTYGSTTYGLVMDVRSGKHWMGEEWSSKGAPTLDIYVRGSTKIRSVEVLGRFKTLFAAGSQDKPLDKDEVEVSWTDPEWSSQTGEQWYYVRVIQQDDEMAWSSPVWVTPARDASASR